MIKNAYALCLCHLNGYAWNVLFSFDSQYFRAPGFGFSNLYLPFIFSCFTTEVLDGFDVQRTSGYAESERRYGYLTCSIIEYYKENFSKVANTPRVCPTYDEFVERCNDHAKKTVSQIFALQLMQVAWQYMCSLKLHIVHLTPWLKVRTGIAEFACNAAASSNWRSCTSCYRALPNSFITCAGILEACQSSLPFI